jgi:flagellar hook-associated protein 1 FlgK
MSLTASLNTANTSLYVTGDQTSVVSRNIANAEKAFYTRKSVEVVTIPGSGVRTSAITRLEEPTLFRNVLKANSNASTYAAMLESLDQLNTTVNDVEMDTSPATRLNSLVNALQNYSAQPQSQLAGDAAVRAARDLANGLNSAAATVQQVRNDADAGVQSSVNRVNALLSQFQTVNDQITKGTRLAVDVTDYLDQRDQILNDLSSEVGIRTLVRGDNDMAVYTESGVTLFDRSPREVVFDRSISMTPGVAGNAVYIDGVPVTGANATMPLQSGRLLGLTQARDEISMTYEAQLDEMARVLVTAFSETSTSNPTLPEVPGLFTYGGATSIPPAGTLVSGLAAALRVNASVDPDQGGLSTRLRDGGISDTSTSNYVYNTTGAASFTDRIDELIGKLGDPYALDPAAKLAVNSTLTDYSSSSVAWLQETRKVADTGHEYQDTLHQRSYESYSKVTGVNLDEELSLMLELERSYQTSSKLITVVDSMFNALVSAIR